MTVLKVESVHKRFRRGTEIVHALEDVNLTLDAGEVCALVGPSGSGKTTLLYVLAGWEIPDEGHVVSSAGDTGTASWEDIALIPQSLGLSEELTVRENVALPLRLSERRVDEPPVDALLERLDLVALADRYPLETSLGEQQRTAVARALVLQPNLILADEPSSHQDDVRVDIIFGLLGEATAAGACCVVATHDPDVIRLVDRVVNMRDGRIERLIEGTAERGERALWGRPT